MILLASSLFLRADRKQLERMKPYAPLATLLIAAALRDRAQRNPRRPLREDQSPVEKDSR